MGYWSILFLMIVGGLCTIGVFNDLYKDTLGERLGMSIIAIWCFQRVVDKAILPATEPVHFMLHVGMLIFAVSMARAKYKARHKIRPPMPPSPPPAPSQDHRDGFMV